MAARLGGGRVKISVSAVRVCSAVEFVAALVVWGLVATVSLVVFLLTLEEPRVPAPAESERAP